MKIRFLSFLVALVMVLGVVPAVTAEAAYTEIQARDVIVSRYSDHMGCRFDGDNYYCLIDADGNAITEKLYTEMRTVYDAPFFRVSVSSADGVHDEGVIDDNGNVIVPAVYADINFISDRWQAGMKLISSGSDDKDYTFTNWSTSEKTFYRIDTVDFYYRGTLVGTLKRSEYEGSVSAYGDYIVVTNRDRSRTFYNSRMEKSPVQATYSSEYDTQYKNGKTLYTHMGSGQAAFTEGCTLTRDEVKKAFIYDKATVYNLQGEVQFKAAQNYDYMNDYSGGYARVTMNSKKGLIDEAGNEIIPVEYDDISYTENPLKYGCVSVAKDGKFGFVNAKNEVTCDFVYSTDIVRDQTTFGRIQNLDGTYIVLSGLVGELPDHYVETSFISSGSRAFSAQNAEKEYTLIDIYGNTLIPYTEGYGISWNQDATVAVVNMRNRVYRLYRFNWDSIPEPEPSPVVIEDGTWTCSNGHSGNTGNFCPECGEPAPAQNVICSGCGAEYAADSVPNFCSNCGTKLK